MNVAGAQEAMLRLMRQLRERDHETEVWFLYEQVPCYCGEFGVRSFSRKKKLSPLEYVTTYFRLIRALKDARPDAVVGFLPLGNVMGLAAASWAGIKTRIASQRSPGPTFGPVMRVLDRIWGRIGIYRDIICVSQAVKDSFDGYPNAYRKRLTVVNNGIDWAGSELDRKEARLSFGIPKDLPLFVATGRFTAQKNYGLMLEAVAGTPGIRIAIAGDGPLRPGMEALALELGISERTHFLGNIQKSRVPDLLRAATGFVQTSLYEGQSNSTLEAMHEGLPIVCSDISMQRETLCDENGDPAALLRPLTEVQSWCDAFAKLRDHDEFSHELGARAKALVSRKFGLHRMIDGFEAVITGEAQSPWQAKEENCVGAGAKSVH
jgi:glycosyltransferase involved in cell wall biosynthesis